MISTELSKQRESKGKTNHKGCKEWKKWEECKVIKKCTYLSSGERRTYARKPIAQIYMYRRVGENTSSVVYFVVAQWSTFGSPTQKAMQRCVFFAKSN
jgi:hypothetical protein